MKISRKEFVKKSLQGAALFAIPTSLSSVLQGCSEDATGPDGGGSSLPTIQGSFSNGKVTITIDATSPLADVGSAALVNYQGGSVLVNHPSENVYNALSSICTHQGCTVSNFDSGNRQHVCPCHGSRYNFNGQVVQGPAPNPLQSFPTEISGDQLIITVG